MQILTVDDDPFHLTVLERALAQIGHTAVPANTGEQALDLLRRGDIRAVITDWEMPGMDGLDLCRAMRKEDFSGYVYLIMLTGREGADPAARAWPPAPMLSSINPWTSRNWKYA